MDQRPPQPPEGKLIAEATERAGLSIREASRRAGLSYGRWRQITSGYQNVSPGSYAAVRAPARTLARMAEAAGLSPEQMETQGQRPDAAAEMRRAVPAPEPPGNLPGPGVFDLPVTAEERAKFWSQVQAEVRRAEMEYGNPDPDRDPRIKDPALRGPQIFADATEAMAWNDPRMNRLQVIDLVASLRVIKDRAIREEGRRTG
jgi:hypothetical protein